MLVHLIWVSCGIYIQLLTFKWKDPGLLWSRWLIFMAYFTLNFVMILSYDKTARLWSVKWWTGIYLSLKCKGCVIPMLSLSVWKAIKSEGYNTSSNVSRPPTLVAHQATRFHKMLFKLYTSKVLHDMFLASTKQLYEWFSLSVCLSVRPSHLFDYVPIIVSSWNFQEVLPMTEVTSMQKAKVRGQRSRSQSQPPT